ncbi:HD domain-containing protein [Streptomyces sp. NPDC048462]|uniref:HD domain-containing protein n=1 Tax=Streptomyces sp. NPDC048462 TaxID=3365555 RepID=UPI0037163C15
MTHAPSSVAGIRVPDTALAREATELVRDTTSELVFHHSRRVFWFGALQGRNRDLGYDPELLYIGAMFHDLGLGERFRTSGRRFEVDSADEARRFLQEHHVPEDSGRRVWTAVALHTTPGIPEHMEPEVALVTYRISNAATSSVRSSTPPGRNEPDRRLAVPPKGAGRVSGPG